MKEPLKKPIKSSRNLSWWGLLIISNFIKRTLPVNETMMIKPHHHISHRIAFMWMHFHAISCNFTATFFRIWKKVQKLINERCKDNFNLTTKWTSLFTGNASIALVLFCKAFQKFQSPSKKCSTTLCNPLITQFTGSFKTTFSSCTPAGEKQRNYWLTWL